MQHIIENLSKNSVVCILLSVFLFLFCFLTNYLLLDSLLKMHRSKSAEKKLKKEYSFSQKLCLLHFKENCRHAIKFCKRLILFQKIGWICLAIYLLLAVLSACRLLPAEFIAWFAIGLFMLFDVPTFVINRILVRPIIFGRLKHFSFEKYHNTDNHESLL